MRPATPNHGHPAPEPWEHPALAASGLEAARARLQTAFSTVQDVPFGRDVVQWARAWGEPGEAGDECLVWVVSGEVRTVRLGAKGVWMRGRDPRVLNLCGPGAYAGLGRAAATLGLTSGSHKAAESELAHYAGVRWTAGDQPEPVRVRTIALGRLRALVEEDTAIAKWFEILVDVGVRHRAENLRLLRGSQLLAGLGLPELNALLCGAVFTKMTLQVEAGQPIDRLQMVVEANVELSTDGARGPSVCMQNRGDLVFASLVVSDREVAVTAPLTARGSPNGTYLEWDRVQMRDILQRSAVAWARMRAFASPHKVAPAIRPVQLIAVVADADDGGRSGLLASGLALALRADGDGQRVWLLDASDGEAVRGAACAAVQVAPYTEQDTQCDGDASDGVDPDATLLCRISCPLASMMAVAERVRARPGVEHVVMHLGAAQLQTAATLWRNNPEAPATRETDLRSLLLESLRRVPHQVVWLNANADGWWTLTDEAPERLIRVDVLTPTFVDALRNRTKDFSGGGSHMHGFEDDRPGCRPDAQVRIPDVGDDFRRAATGLAEQVDAGKPGRATTAARPNVAIEAIWRLQRMVSRTSVGLALGGGGAWGAAHIGLLESLQAAGIPVDYVAGTSFGSVVGGLYAGGGMEALYKLASQSKVPPPVSLLGKVVNRSPGLARLRTQVLGERSPFAAAILRGQLGDPNGPGEALAALIRRGPDHGTISLGELPLPFFPVSSNLTNQLPYAPYWLDFASAITASGSLAPAFPAMHFRKNVLVDGAPLANVPAEAVRNAGADFVIAVNVVGAETLHPPSHESLGARIRAVTRGFAEVRNRGMEGWAVVWLSLWKAGVDQALLHADMLVDLHVSGLTVAEMARMEELAGKARSKLDELEFGKRVHKRRKARPGSPPDSMQIDLRLEAPGR